jgi:hypothetical protein
LLVELVPELTDADAPGTVNDGRGDVLAEVVLPPPPPPQPAAAAPSAKQHPSASSRRSISRAI